jgi:DNA-binding MarR family transcriptional regulator
LTPSGPEPRPRGEPSKVTVGSPAPESTIAGLARIVEVVLDTQGLTIQKYRVLSYLAWRPASPSELADRLTVRPPVVTRLIDGLVLRGFVERHPNDADGRRSIQVLTQAGATVLSGANAAIRAAMDGIEEHLTVEERGIANEGLRLWGEAMRIHWRQTHVARPGQ